LKTSDEKKRKGKKKGRQELKEVTQVIRIESATALSTAAGAPEPSEGSIFTL
jgi:hypothetical protein